MRGVDLRTVKAALGTDRGGLGEAGDQFLDLGPGQGHRLPELAARQAQLHGRRSLGVRIDRGHGLAPGMADLRPEQRPAGFGRSRPAAQCFQHGGIGRTVDDDVAGSLQVVCVDMDIARKQHPATARAPDAVELLQFRRRPSGRIGQPLGHCRLGQAIGQDLPARQGQRCFDHRRARSVNWFSGRGRRGPHHRA